MAGALEHMSMTARKSTAATTALTAHVNNDSCNPFGTITTPTAKIVKPVTVP